MKLCALLFFLLFLPLVSVNALSLEPADGHTTKTLSDYIDDYLETPDDVVDWKMLGKTEIIRIDERDAEGMDVVYDKPKFTDEVKKLDGKKVKIKGYMFPLDETDVQTEFLIGPFPSSCPFQYHVGPNLVFEVHADEHPVTFSYDPITLEGTVELVPDDPEYSTFYRLKNAKQIRP